MQWNHALTLTLPLCHGNGIMELLKVMFLPTTQFQSTCDYSLGAPIALVIKIQNWHGVMQGLTQASLWCQQRGGAKMATFLLQILCTIGVRACCWPGKWPSQMAASTVQAFESVTFLEGVAAQPLPTGATCRSHKRPGCPAPSASWFRKAALRSVMLFNKHLFPLSFSVFPTVLLGYKWCLTWSFQALVGLWMQAQTAQVSGTWHMFMILFE